MIGSDDIIDTIEYAWAPENLQDTYIPTNELVEHAYLRRLLQTFACIVEKSYLEATRCTGMKKPEDLPETYLDTTRALRNAVIARRFATIEQRGYMCLVPFWVQPGDVVLMFMGGEFLYLLRPGSSESYQFVGDIYVYRMTDGAVIGPLELGKRPFEEIVMGGVADIPASARKAGTKDAVSLKIEEFAPNITMHYLSSQYKHMAPRIHSRTEPFYSLDYIEAIVDDLGASEEDPEDEPLWKRMQELRDIYKPTEGVKVSEFTRLSVDFQDTGNVYEGAAPARWTDVNM